VLVANHMSHADGFLIGACVQRFIRFMIWKPYYEMRGFVGFFRMAKAIPVETAPGAWSNRFAPRVGIDRRPYGLHLR